VATGLLRRYISRVENGNTVPGLETLQRMAGAFELPLNMLFYDGKEPPETATSFQADEHGRFIAQVPGNVRAIPSNANQPRESACALSDD